MGTDDRRRSVFIGEICGFWFMLLERKTGTETASFRPAAEPSAENTEAEEDILPFGRTCGREEVNRSAVRQNFRQGKQRAKSLSEKQTERKAAQAVSISR